MFKILNNREVSRILLIYNNGDIYILALYLGICSTDGETFWISMMFEPAKEKPVTAVLLTITGVTDIK